jgi:probable addiction module antidote protein
MTGNKDVNPKNYNANPSAIAEYLTEAFEENDLARILDAMKFVLQAQNVKALAESTGMRREGLYKTFARQRDPQLSRVLGLFQGLDVRIVVRAGASDTKAATSKTWSAIIFKEATRRFHGCSLTSAPCP